jgi:hypothetical protein
VRQRHLLCRGRRRCDLAHLMPPSLRRYPLVPCDRPESRRPERYYQATSDDAAKAQALLGDLLVR